MSERWWEGPLVGFDLETTGVDPETDRIVTAAITLPNGETINWLVNPGVEIPEGAIAVHGISNEVAQAEGVNPAEAVAQIIEALREADCPIVAFNAAFDFTVIDREARRYGLQPFSPEVVIDPHVIDKAIDKYRRGKRTLSAVCDVYKLKLVDAHTADADAAAAVALAKVLGPLVDAQTGSPVSMFQLHDWQKTWRARQAASLEEYFSRTGQPAAVNGQWPVWEVRG